MSVRAKFRVGSVSDEREINQWLTDEGKSGKRLVKDIKLYPVTGDTEENKKFFASTPGGSIELNIVNLSAADYFKPGNNYYVTFDEAE